MTFEELLIGWGLSGVGIGVVTAYLWQKIEEVSYWAAQLEMTMKRVAVAGLAFLVVQAFYWAAIGMLFMPGPATWREWLIATVGYTIAAFGGSTIAHGRVDKGEDPVERYHLPRAIDEGQRLR